MAVEDNKLSIKWALVCSVPDQSIVPQLSDFSSWFVKKVASESAEIGLYFDFETTPALCQYVVPSDIEGCHCAYSRIHTEQPSVQFVLHILPQASSDEYDWMKALAGRYSLVRQGILLENALNRFSNSEHQDVFRNVAQWISRAFHKLCPKKQGSASDLRVGGGVPLANKPNYNPTTIYTSVNKVLHGDRNNSCREESSVHVDGFPASFNEFGVAQLFGELCVTGVSLSAAGAVVAFANKFHAYQAAALDKKVIDRAHTLRVQPLSEEVLVQLQS